MIGLAVLGAGAQTNVSTTARTKAAQFRDCACSEMQLAKEKNGLHAECPQRSMPIQSARIKSFSWSKGKADSYPSAFGQLAAMSRFRTLARTLLTSQA
jgi:hypothetical protein